MLVEHRLQHPAVNVIVDTVVDSKISNFPLSFAANACVLERSGLERVAAVLAPGRRSSAMATVPLPEASHFGPVATRAMVSGVPVVLGGTRRDS